MSSDRRYNTPAWKAVRLVVLERDHHLCQLRLDARCTIRATHVDHIVEPSKGGAFFDLGNLRASCGHCNVAKRNRNIAADARRQRAIDNQTFKTSRQW
jgi:5-methylcytosine-specific restriction enzyme A